MQIYPDTKFYVACPGNLHTGGPELLHQLCSQLIQFGLDSYMFYISGNLENPVDNFYFKYHVPYVTEIEDKPHNVLILFEVIGAKYFEYKKVQKIFWWLSVDVYINNSANIFYISVATATLKPMPKFFQFQAEEKDTEHWVQSEYARQFVMLNGIHEKNIYMVEDYVNQAFLSNAAKIDFSKKENIVAFNPKKGFEVTRRLIEIAPEIQWVPIQNMTPEQVQALLARSKVYIDFGNHPGKDRIPREAAISGCVVITGKRGSAANDIDINIPAEFKFDETEQELKRVIEKIRDIFENFEQNYWKQENYRKRILDDKPRFAREVAAAVNLKSAVPFTTVALAQGYNLPSYKLLQIFSSNKFSFIPKFIVDDRLGNKQDSTGHFIIRKQNKNYFRMATNPTGGGTKYLLFLQAMQNFCTRKAGLKNLPCLIPLLKKLILLLKKFNSAPEDILILNA